MNTHKNTPFGIALIQMKVIKNKLANLIRAEKFLKTAVDLYHPNIVVLPEFFNCPLGVSLEHFAEEENHSPSVDKLKSLAKEMNIDLIGGSLPIWADSTKKLAFNTCFCIDKKGIVKTIYRKTHLFDINIPGRIVYKESSQIAPGNTFGVFDTEYAKFGIGICYDIRFPEYALLLSQKYNVDMLIYPGEFNTVTGALNWEILAKARAVDNQLHVALCSTSRDYENPKAFQAHGHSVVVDPYGQVISTTGHEEAIIYAKVDLTKKDEFRQAIPNRKQKRWDLYALDSRI